MHTLSIPTVRRRAVPDDDLSDHAHQRVAALATCVDRLPHGTSDDDAARVWHAAAWYGEPIGRGNAADLARHAAVAFLCQVLQEPWNFRSRQGRHPHNLGWLQTVSGSATLPFGFMVFMWQVPAVIETAHTIMNGKSPFAEATASDTETSGAEWCK